MMVTAVVIALIAGIAHAMGFAIPDPWRKVVIIGIVVLFVLGLLAFLGLLPRLSAWP